MRFYFAPMEGLTDAGYRQLHHQFFPGVHSYYMPFFSPTIHRTLTPRESRELPRADSVPFRAVPQVMTKNPQDFLWAAQVCRDLGYDEINLNVGCPSGTVVAKGKGAGLLRDLTALEALLEEIFPHSPLPISIKTRIGVEDPGEFPAILQLYNRYPIHELTVHPRVRKAFYAGSVDMDAFRFAYGQSQNPLCYNGDLRSAGQAQRIRQEFPQVESVMLGRALIGNPGMLTPGWSMSQLEQFCDELLCMYRVRFGSSRNAMFRMKEQWGMLLPNFAGSEKLGKKLRKCTDFEEYRRITQEIFDTLPWQPVE